MKSTYYFPHDYNARNDPKIQNILMVMGHEGFYIFWSLVEIMYEQGGKLSLADCEGYAWQLRTTPEKINQLINLAFEKNETQFFSKSVLERLARIKEKSEKAKESVAKRWEKNTNVSKNHTNEDPSKNEGYTVKESKVNEKKEKEIKEEIIADKQQIPSENKNQLKRIVAVLEKEQDTNIVVWGKQARALDLILKAGYSEKQIIAAIKIMAKDPFWQDKSFDLMSVANSIASIKSRVRKEAKQNGILQQNDEGRENSEIGQIATSP